MNNAVRNYSVTLAIALEGGLGGYLHDAIKPVSHVVRAERFEVMAGSGSVLSYWGPDNNLRIPEKDGCFHERPEPSRICSVNHGAGAYKTSHSLHLTISHSYFIIGTS